MGRKLLIVGAGAYSYVVYEIAVETGIFEKIDFLDDGKAFAPNGSAVLGKISSIEDFAADYTDCIIAIGNAEVRLALVERVLRNTELNLCSLISQRAYVAPSATIGAGVVIEPMAVVQSGARIGNGTLISSGAVVNHNAVVEEACHVDCNFVVSSGEVVFKKTKKTLT